MLKVTSERSFYLWLKTAECKFVENLFKKRAKQQTHNETFQNLKEKKEKI